MFAGNITVPLIVAGLVRRGAIGEKIFFNSNGYCMKTAIAQFSATIIQTVGYKNIENDFQ